MSLFDGELDSMPNGILIDTNILLLLIVGAVEKDAISRFRRTRDRFTPSDFDLVARFIDRHFTRLGTTPSILTETSNMLSTLEEPLRTSAAKSLAGWIAAVAEHHTPAIELTLLPNYYKLGLTDCGISAVDQPQYVVLTDDFVLSQVLESAGRWVINFNHLRSLQWLTPPEMS